jgi:hypothetical protein
VSELADLQRRFQAGVLGDAPAVLDLLAGDAAAGAGERLAVYAEGMTLRFLEALDGDYPGVRALTDDAGFERLGREYALAHPSRERSLRWFGAQLAEHLATTTPWSARPELAEMAAFEWRKGELHDAADSEAASVADVAAVPPEEWAVLAPRPVATIRRLDLHFNVPAVWSAVDRGEPMPALSPEPAARPWLLWRRELSIHWRSLDADEAWALDACAEGATFGDLCDGLCERVGEEHAALRAAGVLKQWLTDGVLVSV